MANGRLNIEQKRSKFAFDHKSSPVNDKGKALSSNYDAMVKKTPAYIQTNGLVYTLAFLENKDKGVFNVIWKWHCISNDNHSRLEELKNITEVKFVEKLITLNDEQIRFVTLETLSLLTWLRRFVKDDE